MNSDHIEQIRDQSHNELRIPPWADGVIDGLVTGPLTEAEIRNAVVIAEIQATGLDAVRRLRWAAYRLHDDDTPEMLAAADALANALSALMIRP
ncbi:hypothetical protein [Streptomyces sp. NPDC007355]|uniref:hypothetical protein n=1 Tax=Streptomyces sp. NPDC007355 TaxID=3364778 RepID=UPI00369D5EA4